MFRFIKRIWLMEDIFLTIEIEEPKVEEKFYTREDIEIIVKGLFK